MLRNVETKYGILRGLVGKDSRIAVFRGVPYAKPPIGELRWKAPQEQESWEGVKTCYEYGPMPMMRRNPGEDKNAFYTKELHPVAMDYEMSEDCLYLNIFTPAETPDDNLPVFCYIHGGGLQDGYNYEIEFDGERVARRGVVVVMISYRLGLFGFLAHPEITAETPAGEPVSNFGMQDQSMALHWVKDNIKAFGGDPDRIVIAGQSAGAGSVQTQICSPKNEGIIKGAICQSAVSMGFGENFGRRGRGGTLADAEKTGIDFFEKAGIKDLAEARSLDAKDLMKRLLDASPKGSMFGYFFGTCIDGVFITEDTVSCYYNDHLPDIPMMVGVCMGESVGGMFGGGGPKYPTYEEFLANAENYGEDKEAFLAAADVHSDEDVKKIYDRYDFNGMIGGSRGFCELRSAMGKKVYFYIFDHDIPGDNAGSFHGSDLWFMFDSLANSWRPFEGKHYDLARQVCSYWTNFVKCGDPNGDGKDYNGNPLPEWRPYTPADSAVMMFRDVSATETMEESPVIKFRVEYGKKHYIK